MVADRVADDGRARTAVAHALIGARKKPTSELRNGSGARTPVKSDNSLMPLSFTRTLRLKVRSEAYAWLDAAAMEVNECRAPPPNELEKVGVRRSAPVRLMA